MSRDDIPEATAVRGRDLFNAGVVMANAVRFRNGLGYNPPPLDAIAYFDFEIDSLALFAAATWRRAAIASRVECPACKPRDPHQRAANGVLASDPNSGISAAVRCIGCGRRYRVNEDPDAVSVWTET